MENRYVFELEQIEEIRKLLGQINSNMEESFRKSQTILNSLRNNENWKGEFRNTFIPYYHLILQYHGQLCGKTTQSIGSVGTVSAEMNPIQKLQEAVKDLMNDVTNFPNNSEQYKALKEVGR